MTSLSSLHSTGFLGSFLTMMGDMLTPLHLQTRLQTWGLQSGRRKKPLYIPTVSKLASPDPPQTPTSYCWLQLSLWTYNPLGGVLRMPTLDVVWSNKAMAFIGISVGKGKAWQNSLGSTSLNNFRGLWAIGVISSCLVPGPGMIKIEKYCLLGCKDQIEEVWNG